ncbi:hypothetical protein BDV96DRAFT_652845 [Lophiotrema nucula]|uniref:Uncharacterized protein n=1 Tax=Lophiotrema nucula TaxID=690887 RepID=A0A6A5YNA2_9PLEO|nr:hypothetical protein BDV96DRAFT_652845 [Lophiotrema nucula]
MKLTILAPLFLHGLPFVQGYKLDDPSWLAQRGATISPGQPIHRRIPESRLDGLVKRARFVDERRQGWQDLRPDAAPDHLISEGEEEIIRESFANAQLFARAMLQVPRDDALYTHVFGDPTGELYDDVMANVRRVANIFSDRVTNADGVDGDILIRVFRGGQQGFNERSNAFTAGNRIYINERFFDDQEFLHAPPVRLATGGPLDILRHDAGYLDEILQHNRGALIFHELIHFVSRGRMLPVFDRAITAGAVMRSAQGNINTDAFRTYFTGAAENQAEQAVIDIRLLQMSASDGTQARDQDNAIGFGIDPAARAYGVNMVGRLARTSFGRFAATLNADSYAAMAAAALSNLDYNVFTPDIPNVPPFDGPTTQNSIWVNRVEINDSSPMADIIREKENLSWFGILTAGEKVDPEAFTKGHELR